MKKAIFLLGFVIFTKLMFSQGLKLGIDLCPGIGWLDVQTRFAEANDKKFAFLGSLNIDHYFTKNYAFSTGLSIGQENGKIQFQDSIKFPISSLDEITGKNTIDFKNSYISVPVGFKLKTQEFGKTNIFAKIGFNNKINIRSHAKVIDDNDNILLEDEIKDDISIYSLCYFIGGGMEYHVSEDNAIRLGVTYQTALLNTFKNNPKTYLNTLFLNIGINF